MKKLSLYAVLCSALLSGSMFGSSAAQRSTLMRKLYFYQFVRAGSGLLLLRHHGKTWIVPAIREIPSCFRSLSSSMNKRPHGSSSVTSSGGCSDSGCGSSSISGKSFSLGEKRTTDTDATSNERTSLLSWDTMTSGYTMVTKRIPDGTNKFLGDVGKGISKGTAELIKEVGTFAAEHGVIQAYLFYWSHNKIKEVKKELALLDGQTKPALS